MDNDLQNTKDISDNQDNKYINENIDKDIRAYEDDAIPFYGIQERINGNFNKKIRALRKKHAIELLDTSKKFDRFHSPLRFFNATSINSTNCHRGLIFGPALNQLGLWLNFMNDKDCEIMADFKNPIYSKKEKAKAVGKLLLSSLGALLRVTASIVDYVLDAVTSPIATLKNWLKNGFGLFRQRKRASSRLFGNYKILESKSTFETKASKESKESQGSKESKANAVGLHTLTLNCGLLRDLYWDFKGENLNGLRRPRVRAQELADIILDRANNAEKEGKPFDVICLQEIFDNLAYFGLGQDAQSILMDRLKTQFPYIIYDIGKKSWPMVSSGLMVLSRHPILDVEYHRYSNLGGIDILSNKGFVAAKIKKGDRFFTVYNTHLQAGATNSGERRGNEMGLIQEHMKRWQETPPNSPYQHLKYLDTIMMGDLNEGLNNPEKMFAKTHGKKPSRKAGTIKYMGKAKLFNELSSILPENFVDLRVSTPIPVITKTIEQYDLYNVKRDKQGRIVSAFVEWDVIEGKVTAIKGRRSLSVEELEKLNSYLQSQALIPIIVIEHPKNNLYNFKNRTYREVERNEAGELIHAKIEKRSFWPPFRKEWVELSKKELDKLNAEIEQTPNARQELMVNLVLNLPDLRIKVCEEHEAVVHEDEMGNVSHTRKMLDKQTGQWKEIPLTFEEESNLEAGYGIHIDIRKKGFDPNKVQLFEQELGKSKPEGLKALNNEIYLGTAIREDYLRRTEEVYYHPSHRADITGGKLIDTNLSRNAQRMKREERDKQDEREKLEEHDDREQLEERDEREDGNVEQNDFQCKKYHSRIMRFSKPGQAYPTDHLGLELMADYIVGSKVKS